MTDVKISNLPAATTPLDGTEVTPIVQSGTTKKVSIANVTAGRAISADSLTLTTPLSVANGGTGVTGSTGTGSVVLNTTPTFATSVLFPDGSVSAPSIAHAGDTNCGFYFGTDTIYAATNGTNALTVDSSQNVSVVGTLAMGSSFLRNRIINGDMRIDQRNAGASVTPTTGQFSVDRWSARLTQASKFSVQQSTTVPNNTFTNAILATSASAYSVLSTDNFALQQVVEGFNVADLAWGTSDAKAVTLSFWARSSIAGTNTYAGSIRNDAGTGSYVFTYTLAANTWTYVTVNIPGPSSTYGSWVTNNGAGIYLQFSLGTGSNYNTTANAWQAGNYLTTSGATSVVGTNGATFYITGVQLEVGSVATPFERRQYGTELLLAQRYYWQLDSSSYGPYSITGVVGSTDNIHTFYNPAPMRVAPTATFASGSFTSYYFTSAGSGQSTATITQGTTTVYFNTNLNGGRFYYVKSGQTGLACWADFISTAKFTFSSEL